MYTTVHTCTRRATTETSAVSERAPLPSLSATHDARFLDSAERTITADANDYGRRQSMHGRVNGRWPVVSMANACGPPTDSSDMPPSPSPSCPARPSSPLTPHCLQSIGPGLLDRSIALYRAVAVCALAQSPRSQQLQAHARVCQLATVFSDFFSPHRLPPRQSATAWPVCRSLLLGPSSVVPIPSPPRLSLPTGLHGLWYSHSTILLPQARLFLVPGDPYCAPSDP